MAWNFKSPAGAAAAAPAPAPTPAPAPAAPVSAAPPPPVAAAPLPPVTAPAPVAPPAAAAAAPAARRRGRPPAAAATAPITQVPGQQTLPITAPAAAAPAAPMVYTGFLGALIPAVPPARTAAQSFIAGETQAGEPNIFPTCYLTGGSTGGMFDNHEMNEEGSDVDLPAGRKSFYGILLGYRSGVIAWSAAYVEGQAAKPRPRWQGWVSYLDAEVADVVQNACQRYTFRDRNVQAKYDPYGHPSPMVEMLMFDQRSGLFCVRSGNTYDSTLCSLKTIYAAFPNGQVQPVPVRVDPVSEPRSSKTRAWNEHYLNVVQFAGGAVETATEVAAFSAFVAQVGQDPELTAAIVEWNKTTLTPDQIQALQAVATL